MGFARGRVSVLMLLGLAGILLLGASPAYADPAVTFADDQPIVIDLTSCPPSCSQPVLVVNSATHGGPVDVTITATGPAAKHLKLDKKPITVPPGLKRIKVTVVKGAFASVGTLILTASDGSLSREPIHLVGAFPPPGKASPRTLRPGTFDVLSVRATSFVPSFFRPLPSLRIWGFGGLITLAMSALFFCVYWAWRNKSGASPTIAAILAIGASIISLLLLSGSAASYINEERHSHVIPSQSWALYPPAPGRIDGNLTGDNGQLGQMVANGSTLTIKNVPSAGTYGGSLDTQPTGQDGVIKATVIVRDWWPYAFAAVLMGVLLGWAISLFYVRRPARQIKADAAAAAATIAHHESDWCEKSVGRTWSEPYAFAGFAQDAITKILSLATTNPDGATADLLTLNDLDTAMEGLRSVVADLAAQRAALCAHFAEFVGNKDVPASPGWLAPLQPALDLAGQPLGQVQTLISERRGLVPGVKAAADMASQLCARLAEMTQGIGALGGQARESLHDQWVSLLDAVLTAANEDRLESLKNQIDTLERSVQEETPAEEELVAEAFAREGQPWWLPHFLQLAGQPIIQLNTTAAAVPQVALGISPSANRDTLLTVTIRATGLEKNTNVHWEFSDGSKSAVFPAPPPEQDSTTELSIRHSFVVGPEQASAAVVREDGQPISEPWIGDVDSFSIAQRLRTGLGADDRAVAIVAGILAVASGMAALYLSAPAWGSAGDYIAALLWGSVTSEGVKLVVNSVGKRWPIAS